MAVIVAVGNILGEIYIFALVLLTVLMTTYVVNLYVGKYGKLVVFLATILSLFVILFIGAQLFFVLYFEF